MEPEEREAVYGEAAYYWGQEPNDLARRTLDWADQLDLDGSIIDLGAGEGRDAVYFAEQGFDVTAVDLSPAGLVKTERLAAERGVAVDTLEADLNTFQPPEPVDVVYSVGAVQYVRPDRRARQFERFRNATRPGGLHVIFAFVDPPDVPTPPDWTASEHFYAQEELAGYYEGWTTLESSSIRFGDDSGGEPHEHAAEIVAAHQPRE